LHDEHLERKQRALIQGFEVAAKQLHAAAEANAAFEVQLAMKERNLEALAAAHATAAEEQTNEANYNVGGGDGEPGRNEPARLLQSRGKRSKRGQSPSRAENPGRDASGRP
jgi:hypothetical protein